MDALFARLGLTRKETDIFLKLLTLGAQPVSIVAKHAGVPRSSMYFVIDRLKDRRLVETFERKGITYVKCIPVRDIADVLKAEERTIAQTLHLLEEKLPELMTLENTLSVTPKVTFSEGKDAVMKMYASLVRERDFYSLFNQEILQTVIPEYRTLIPDILKENAGSAKELIVHGDAAQAYQKEFQSKRHQIKLLPKHVTFLSDCILCRDRMCMITYGENQVAAIEIFSSTVVQTHRAVFETLWESL